MLGSESMKNRPGFSVGGDGALQRSGARQHRVQPVARVDVQHVANAAATHVGVYQQHALAGIGNGAGKVGAHHGFALIGARGGDGDGLNFFVDRRKADVGQKRARSIVQRRDLERPKALAVLLCHAISPFRLFRACGKAQAAPAILRRLRRTSRYCPAYPAKQ